MDMKRTIELKHVGPRHHVHQWLEELIDRLEAKLRYFPSDAVSLHAVFEEHGTRKLYRTSLTCHVPGHTVVAHEEDHAAGSSIRRTFAEVERQLDKRKALLLQQPLRKRRKSGRVPPAEHASTGMPENPRAFVSQTASGRGS